MQNNTAKKKYFYWCATLDEKPSYKVTVEFLFMVDFHIITDLLQKKMSNNVSEKSK